MIQKLLCRPLVCLLAGVAACLSLAAQAPAEATWRQVARITPPADEEYSRFGYSVAYAGEDLVIGAAGLSPSDLVGSPFLDGAYRFDRATRQEVYQYPAELWDYSHFGYDIATNDQVSLITAYGSGFDEGEASVYDNVTGELLHTLSPASVSERQGFGSSAALNDQYALVGAWGQFSWERGVYQFDLQTGQQVHEFSAPDAAHGSERSFGTAVGLSDTHAYVGWPDTWTEEGTDGAVFAYSLQTGELSHTFHAPRSIGRDFGRSIGISGNVIAVGDPSARFDDRRGGAVFLFDLDSGDMLRHMQVPEGVDAHYFGRSIAIDDDLTVVGARLRAEDGTISGTAFVYDTDTGQMISRLVATDPSDWAFGISVAIDAGEVLVGSPEADDSYNSRKGVAYAFRALDVGDYNGSGVIDLEDYDAWSDALGRFSGDLMADGNADGVVNAADYTVWRDAYAAMTASSVPEPSTIFLMLMVMVMVMGAVGIARRSPDSLRSASFVDHLPIPAPTRPTGRRSRRPTIHRLFAGTLFFASLLLSLPTIAVQPLPRATPESQGIASAAVLDFVDQADAQIDTLNSFMLVRHGKVVAEGWWAPYRAEDPHMLYSLSKSFTSTAVGLAIDEGKMSLDDRVVDAFPDLAPAEPSANLRAMRVRDLLRMATGHTAGQVAGFPYNAESGVREFLALPVGLKPGTHFVYNTPATYAAAAMVEKATGQPLHDYLTPRLFEPLGIEGSWWERTTEGVATGGFGLNLRTEDIAKFGQLLLQRGRWEGEQLVSAAWIDEATSLQTSNGSDPDGDWDQGYGYQFWLCTTGGYRGDGAFGQFCLVMPKQDAVVAITSGTNDLGRVMKLVWEHLQASMRDEPLPENAPSVKKLDAKLASLSVAMPEGNATSPEVETVTGETYYVAMDPLGLDSLRLDFEDDRATLTFTNDQGPQTIAVGNREWARGHVVSVHGLCPLLNYLVAPPSGKVAVAASGAWINDDAYQARLCLNETPFYVDLTLRFDGEEVEIVTRQNVSFLPTEQPKRIGVWEAAE